MLGAGAIGCLFASALHRSGCTTTLLLREGAAGNTRPVVVQRHDQSSELQLPVATAADCGPISHLLVTTKAYDARAAVTAVAAHLDQDSQILLMVNGMGVADALRDDFPQLDIFLGTTTAGAQRIAPLHIIHAGRGQTRIGQAGRAAPPTWFEQWSSTLDDCLWDTDIEQALWQKLAINCAINPLTALHGCSNGELAQNPSLARALGGLCREIAQISEAAGYRAVAAQLEQSVKGVIDGTADNRSSMLQDVQAARPTEIDYITGYLLQVARRHGMAAPRNSELLARIHKLAH